MEWIELDKLIKFQTKSKIKAGEGKSEGKYLMYTSSMIVDKYLDEFQYNEEALIMGTGGSASIHYSTGNFGTSTDCYVLYNKGKNIMLKYIYLYLLGNINILEEGFRGAGLKHTNQKYIKSIKIPVPSLKIQEKIVKVLDQSQALIDKRKEQIEALDQLIESIFYTMFGDPVRNEKGWEVKELGEHIDVLGGYAFKSKEYTDIGIPIIKIGNINRGFFEEKNLCYYEEREDLNRYIIKPGDLLMSLTGTVGKNDYGNLCIIDDTFEKYYLNQRNAKLEILNSLNKLYLTYLLRTNRLKAELTKNNRGVRQANISNDDIKNLRIPIPHIYLQNEFAQKVEVIEKQKELLNQSLELLEENYKSIMDKAFKGQLFN